MKIYNELKYALKKRKIFKQNSNCFESEHIESFQQVVTINFVLVFFFNVKTFITMPKFKRSNIELTLHLILVNMYLKSRKKFCMNDLLYIEWTMMNWMQIEKWPYINETHFNWDGRWPTLTHAHTYTHSFSRSNVTFCVCLRACVCVYVYAVIVWSIRRMNFIRDFREHILHLCSHCWYVHLKRFNVIWIKWMSSIRLKFTVRTIHT